MPQEIDFNDLPDLPKRLAEKLRVIRERTKLSPDEFAAHVGASDGVAITAYEAGEDMPTSVLIRYAKLSGLPLENLIEDDRDLWFGHRVN